MKLDISTIKQKLSSCLSFFKKYTTLFVILVILWIFGYLIINIQSLISKEPSESVIEEKINATKTAKIDRSAIEQIKKLQSINIEIKTLFDQARDNPFQE